MNLKCTGCAEANCKKDCLCRCHEILHNIERAKNETWEEMIEEEKEKKLGIDELNDN
jgi:hypothetical protein